jgi:hypothetical protein
VILESIIIQLDPTSPVEPRVQTHCVWHVWHNSHVLEQPHLRLAGKDEGGPLCRYEHVGQVAAGGADGEAADVLEGEGCPPREAAFETTVLDDGAGKGPAVVG